MKKVSIVIPVYNAEKYIERCMESCLRQTLEDIEVIAVDNACTDNSLRILRGYEAKYPDKIRVVTLNENLRAGGGEI